MRLREIHGEEYNRAAKYERVISLRMNPERDKQTGGLNKQKMRLLVRGDLEPKEWNAGKQTDAPTTNASTVKMMVALADTGEEVEELSIGGISKAFIKSWLYGPEESARYVSLKMHKGAKKRIFELLGSLYGQVDAGLRWYDTLKDYLVTEEGMICSKNEPCLFIHPETRLKFAVHTDDGICRATKQHSEAFWQRLRKRFGLKHQEYVTPTNSPVFCGIRLGMTQEGSNRVYTMDQNIAMGEFIGDAVENGLRPTTSPMPNKTELYSDSTLLPPTEAKWFRSKLMGASWFANMTRVDIVQPVNRAAQFMANPTVGARIALMRILAYLQGQQCFTLCVRRCKENTYEFFVDSDHAGDTPITTRSTTGIILLLNGMPVTWASKKQPMTALSSAVAEIYAFSEAVKHAQFLIWRMQDVGHNIQKPIKILEDNAATIYFQTSTKTNTKIRGIYNLRWTWIRELRDMAKIIAVKVATGDNIADLLTKCQPRAVMEKFIKYMGITH